MILGQSHEKHQGPKKDLQYASSILVFYYSLTKEAIKYYEFVKMSQRNWWLLTVACFSYGHRLCLKNRKYVWNRNMPFRHYSIFVLRCNVPSKRKYPLSTPAPQLKYKKKQKSAPLRWMKPCFLAYLPPASAQQKQDHLKDIIYNTVLPVFGKRQSKTDDRFDANSREMISVINWSQILTSTTRVCVCVCVCVCVRECVYVCVCMCARVCLSLASDSREII